MAQALKYYHQKGFVHNDISPRNVCWDGKKAWIIDLGGVKDCTGWFVKESPICVRQTLCAPGAVEAWNNPVQRLNPYHSEMFAFGNMILGCWVMSQIGGRCYPAIDSCTGCVEKVKDFFSKGRLYEALCGILNNRGHVLHRVITVAICCMAVRSAQRLDSSEVYDYLCYMDVIGDREVNLVAAAKDAMMHWKTMRCECEKCASRRVECTSKRGVPPTLPRWKSGKRARGIC